MGKNAPGLKTLNDAITIREKVYSSLEITEKLKNSKDSLRYLTFVIIGGGPIGVELAGALSEILTKNVTKDYKFVGTRQIKIYLIEGIERLLPSFPAVLSLRAKRDLEKLGVKILLNTRLTDITENGVIIGNEIIESNNVIWAAGNESQPILKTLNIPVDRDRGSLATIGRAKAVALIKGFKFTGLIAWFLWVFVHILFLNGFRNKAIVIIEWIWYYFSLKPGIRLIIQKGNSSTK